MGSRSQLLEEYQKRQETSATRITQPPGIALESVIDPATYIMGPSDGLLVSVWTSPPLAYTLTVSPEGTLVIPTIGELRVADLSLAEAKQQIVGQVRKRYIQGEISVTLTTPRPIVVMVSGHVRYPGLYTLSAVDRAHRAIELANTPISPEPRVGFKELMGEMSSRNVVLTHRDGTSSRVDIDMFLATHEDRYSPFLREGDVVTVPRKAEGRNVIAIYGAVNAPGRYEYVAGDSLNDLFKIAHGFTRFARTDSIMLYRLAPEGESMERQTLDAGAVLAGQAMDLPLEQGDRVVVLARPDLREDYRATILGEVLYPGTYPITRDSTRLSALVRMAGGFTPDASLRSAYVMRKATSRGIGVDTLIARRGLGGMEDLGYYDMENVLRSRQEYVPTDFIRLFEHADSSCDTRLRSEDTVYVPPAPGTVYVYGQVVNPGHVPYLPGSDLSYYIKAAGGVMEMARDDDIKVVKSTTKQWLSADDAIIEEGDYIWVPKEYERGFGYYLGIVAQSAAILSVAISTIVLVTR